MKSIMQNSMYTLLFVNLFVAKKQLVHKSTLYYSVFDEFGVNQKPTLRAVNPRYTRQKRSIRGHVLIRKSKDDISNNLYDLDQILSNLFVEVRPESTEEMEAALKVDYVSLLSHYLPSENDCIWLAITSSLLVFSYLLYTGCLSLWRFLGSLFFISSVWHWIRMYKKALADKDRGVLSVELYRSLTREETLELTRLRVHIRDLLISARKPHR